MADWIWMPFGVVSGVGQGIGVLDWVGDCGKGRGSFGGKYSLREGQRRGSSQITLWFLVVISSTRVVMCVYNWASEWWWVDGIDVCMNDSLYTCSVAYLGRGGTGRPPPFLPERKTRSPAVARMADRTASCSHKANPTGHNLAKTGTSPLNGPIMRQQEAYQATFCTLRTTSGFIFLLPVVWSDLATNKKWSLSQ